MRFSLTILLIFLFSQSLSSQYREWLLQSLSDNELNVKSLAVSDASIESLSKNINCYLLKYDKPVNRTFVESQIVNYNKEIVISPNLKLEPRSIEPDDPLFEDQWNLDIIQAQDAWNITTGGSFSTEEEIVIAVLDDGFDINHSDLKNQLWSNVDEIPGDGIDNDGNGYIDDHLGLNIESQNDSHYFDSHGSRVAGVFGAEGNNGIGITGINWNTKILYLSNVTNVAEIIKAYDYVYELKKRYIDSGGTEGANIVVTNYSAGLQRRFPSEYPAWCQVYNLLGSVGILSVGATPNENYNIDAEGDLPSLCGSNYLIVVTSTNRSDIKVVKAATSKRNVDLGAPGDGVMSTDTSGSYKLLYGTSASAPHVTGAIGLMYSAACEDIINQLKNDPAAAALSVKQALLNGIDSLPSLSQTVSGGRLNIFKSILGLSEYCGQAEAQELEIRSIGTELAGANRINISIEYETNNFSPHKVYIFDIIGRKVYEQDFSPNVFLEKKVLLENLNLGTGTYIVSLSDSNKIVSKKILIVN